MSPGQVSPLYGREPIEEVSDVPERSGPPLERAEAGASVRPCGGLQSGPSQNASKVRCSKGAEGGLPSPHEDNTALEVISGKTIHIWNPEEIVTRHTPRTGEPPDSVRASLNQRRPGL